MFETKNNSDKIVDIINVYYRRAFVLFVGPFMIVMTGITGLVFTFGGLIAIFISPAVTLKWVWDTLFLGTFRIMYYWYVDGWNGVDIKRPSNWE